MSSTQKDPILKVAFVHDWLVSYRGGEKVLEQMLPLFPNAPIYTLYCDRTKLPESLQSRKIIPVNSLKFFGPLRKALLLFYPSLIEAIDLSEYDLIVSTSSCVAKGIIPKPGAKHFCYIHSPMRYIWDQAPLYLSTLYKIPVVSLLVKFATSYLRMWDCYSSWRVDRFVANSHFVKSRVQKYYGKDCGVVPPPVDIHSAFLTSQIENTPDTDKTLLTKKIPSPPYFIAGGSLQKYKRIDIAIEAAKIAQIKLKIIGDGPQKKNLEKLADGSEYIEFLGSIDDNQLREEMKSAQAFLFPGVEDFGIIAIEAMACGIPVIALKEGGSLDFIEHGKNGFFIDSQQPGIWASELKIFKKSFYDSEFIRQYSRSFSPEIFLKKIKEEIERLVGRRLWS